MITNSLLQDTKQLQVETNKQQGQVLILSLSTTLTKARCPKCETFSSRVHSHYQRYPADLPWAGRAVRIHLKLKCFFCDDCFRRTDASMTNQTDRV